LPANRTPRCIWIPALSFFAVGARLAREPGAAVYLPLRVIVLRRQAWLLRQTRRPGVSVCPRYRSSPASLVPKCCPFFVGIKIRHPKPSSPCLYQPLSGSNNRGQTTIYSSLLHFKGSASSDTSETPNTPKTFAPLSPLISRYGSAARCHISGIAAQPSDHYGA
jgi:hypothetical protein